MSCFWEKVDEELNFRGMPRKELARMADFPDSYISKGIARKSIPSADLALRIAHSLNVSIEYLLDMNYEEKSASITEKEFKLFRKYLPIINFLESTTEHDNEVIKEFLNTIMLTR